MARKPKPPSPPRPSIGGVSVRDRRTGAAVPVEADETAGPEASPPAGKETE